MDDSGVALEFNNSNSELENSMIFTENFEESKKTAKSEVDEMLEKSLQLLENTEIKSSSEPDYFSQIQAHTRSLWDPNPTRKNPNNKTQWTLKKTENLIQK